MRRARLLSEAALVRCGRRGVARRMVLPVALACCLAATAWGGRPVIRRFFLPETTGSIRVGVRQLFFSDSRRDEPFTVQASDVRRFVAPIYYPAQYKPDDARTVYMDALSASVWATLRGLWQRFELNVVTRAFRDAPPMVDSPRLPVVIFSHDLYGLPENYHAIITDLVSHGYVVVAINHTHMSAGVLFAEEGFVSERIWSHGFANKEAQQRAMTSYLPTLIADIRFVVDELQRRDADETFFLSGRLDLARVGVWGHGYGAWAAAEALRADDRIVAGVGLAGSVEDPAQVPLTMPKPFLHVVGAQSRELIGTQFRSDATDLWELVIDGAGRSSFEDVALLRQRFDRNTSALRRRQDGHPDSTRTIAITRAYVRAFFDHYLRGQDLGILTQAEAPFAEAHLTH